MAPSEPRFDVEPSVNNHFAWLRTQMGLARTLMAAVRTAISLIGFGFTVAQFFQKLQGDVPEGMRRLGPQAPRDLGLTLIAAGVLSLAAFTWQYRTALIYLRGPEFQAIAVAGDRAMRSSVYVTAFVVIGIGLAAFASVFARL